jgi:hypothetical protein
MDLTLVRAGLAARANDVVEALLGRPNPLVSNKREWRFGRKGPLSVEVSGPKAGCWYDHQAGQGGDLLDLIQRERGGTFRDAVKYARVILGASVTETRPRPTEPWREGSGDDAARTRRALELWNEALPLGISPAADYLMGRGITELPPVHHSLRYHPSCPFGPRTRHPSLVAAMVDVRTNEFRALHRTALTRDGQKLDRKVLGRKAGACIKISPDDSVTLGLTIGEGIETVLAGMMLGFSPGWATGDASNLAAIPVLSGIADDGCLTILVDHDEAGKRAAALCAKRWVAAGAEVIRHIPNELRSDFNDLIRGAA